MDNNQVLDSSPDSGRLAADIAQCSDYAALERTLFHTVAKKIGAETSVLLQFRSSGDGYEFFRDSTLGVEADSHHQYVNRYHRTDPLITDRKPTLLPSDTRDVTTDVYRLSDVSDPNKFIQTRYYNEFLKPTGIRHILALAIRPQSQMDDLMVLVGFHRPNGMRDFGDHAVKYATQIAPIVGSTIAKLTFKENLNKSQTLSDGLQSILHRQRTGFMILDDALQIQEISPFVSSGLYGDLPFLMGHISSGCQTLGQNESNAVTFTCSRYDEGRTRINENISIELTRIKTSKGRHHFVVKLALVHANIAIMQCAQKFSWTNRESEIVMALAQGLTNTQVAAALTISVRTVENHLRSIYTKADVTSRTQLLRQLLICTPAMPSIVDS